MYISGVPYTGFNAVNVRKGKVRLEDTGSAYGGIVVPTTLTADRTYTLPDSTGTIALTNSVTGATTGTISISSKDSIACNAVGSSLYALTGIGVTNVLLWALQSTASIEAVPLAITPVANGLQVMFANLSTNSVATGGRAVTVSYMYI